MKSYHYKCRLGIRAWIAYDFINSILIINGSLYFSAWLTQDQHVSSFWYGLTTVISTVLLLVVLPLKGALLDFYRLGRHFLFGTSIGIGLSAVALTGFGHWPGARERIVWSLVAFGLINFLYQASLVSYNWILGQLEGVETLQDVRRVSGLGEAAGSIGSVIGALIGAGLLHLLRLGLEGSSGDLVWVRQLGSALRWNAANEKLVRIDLFIPLGALFLVLFLIDYWFLRRGIKQQANRGDQGPGGRMSWFREIYGVIRRNERLRHFLMAFFLYGDAILTVQLYIPIFMRERIGLGDTGVSMAFAISLSAGALGAWVFSVTSTGINLKKLIVGFLAGWTCTLVGFGLTSNRVWFFFLMIVAGLLYGGLWSASRAYLIEVSESESLGRAFGFYAIFERCASIVGPLVWGAIMLMPLAAGRRYMFAFVAMSVLVMVGGVILMFSEDAGASQAADHS
jgi:MFS transporter, UMF1 family